MKGRLGKFGLLFLVVALALALTGAGYAMWDKTLYIDGTVNTGEVNMEILSASSDDPPGSDDYGYTKDVGTTTVSYTIGGQSISVNVTNAYPCYEVRVHFTAHNNGTVPVKLQDIKLIGVPAALTVTGSDGIGEQIDPCEERDNTIKIHVLQSAKELATYTFTVQYYYVQWNEYTP